MKLFVYVAAAVAIGLAIGAIKEHHTLEKEIKEFDEEYEKFMKDHKKYDYREVI